MRANSAPTSRLSIALLFFSLQALGRTAAPHGLPSDVASRVPDCGLGCLQQLINSATANASSACLEAGTDAACLCEKDISQYGSVLSCVQANCTIEDAIDTARGAWEACGKPQRSRKADLLVPLSIEVPALICILLRLYSRWWSTKHFEADDYIMMVVAVFYTVFEGLGFSSAQLAFGVDVWTVDSATLTLSLKFFYVGETFYLTILTLTKASILCFYLRIFPDRNFRLVAYAVMAWVVLSGMVFVSLQIFQCMPINFIWEGWKKGEFGPYRCLDINTLGFTMAAFNIAQDIAILILPLPRLAKLDVSRRSRLCIMAMFSLGVFVLVTSCVRLWAIYSFGDSVNPTWDYTNALIWTGLEVAVSIIVTSLPAIRVLISRRGNLHWSLGGRGRRGHEHDVFGNTTTSSFGDTTIVGSWHGAPPALKRLSAISRISSIVVKTPTDEEMLQYESRLRFGAKLTFDKLTFDKLTFDKPPSQRGIDPKTTDSPGGDVLADARSNNEHAFLGSFEGGYGGAEDGISERDTGQLPNINGVLLGQRPASSPPPLSHQPSMTRVETATTTTTTATFVNEAQKGDGY